MVVFIACTLVGLGVAFVVSLLHEFIEAAQSSKLKLLYETRRGSGVVGAWSLHLASTFVCALLAFGCVVLVPHARGSGLPQLIAYLNGIKLPKFTSLTVLATKWLGTALVVIGGLFCGPEGPIIHMGACVGKLLLRALYHLGEHAAAARVGPLRSCPRWNQRSLDGAQGSLMSLAYAVDDGLDGDSGVRSAFLHFRNDLDERDFVAIGAGAGVCAAFLAPISGTLFVVEEASSHFSLALLWRAFYAAIVTLLASHGLRRLWGGWIFGWLRTDERSTDATFSPVFAQGTGQACQPEDVLILWLVPLAVLLGLLGAAFNLTVLRLNAARRALYQRLGAEHEAAWAGGRRRFVLVGALEILLLSLLSTSASVLLAEAWPCHEQRLGAMYFGEVAACTCNASIVPPPHGACAQEYGQCGGEGFLGPHCCRDDGPLPLQCDEVNAYYSQCVPSSGGRRTPAAISDACMAADLRAQIHFASANGTADELCDCCCLASPLTAVAVQMLSQYGCAAQGAPHYSSLGTLLLGSAEDTVKALFLRGLPGALSAPALALALLCWFVLTALTAGAPLPCGLLIPLIITGACAGRLYGLVLAMGLHEGRPDPGLFALFGATAMLAGSGQIRLFLTMVMLEVTGQVELLPFVAVAAIVGDVVASSLTRHGLYHALIEAARLPYLPLERPPEFDEEVLDTAPYGAFSRRTPVSAALGTALHAAVQGARNLRHWARPPPCVPPCGAPCGVPCDVPCDVPWGGPCRADVLFLRPWESRLTSDALIVRDVMTPLPLQTVRYHETRRALLRRLGSPPPHSGLPVLGPCGELVGLVTIGELHRLPDDEATVERAMDRCPCLCHEGWPCSRAHRLFAALGLRHLLVVGPHMQLVGILTRHDLQPGVLHARRRSTLASHTHTHTSTYAGHTHAHIDAPTAARMSEAGRSEGARRTLETTLEAGGRRTSSSVSTTTAELSASLPVAGPPQTQTRHHTNNGGCHTGYSTMTSSDAPPPVGLAEARAADAGVAEAGVVEAGVAEVGAWPQYGSERLIEGAMAAAAGTHGGAQHGTHEVGGHHHHHPLHLPPPLPATFAFDVYFRYAHMGGPGDGSGEAERGRRGGTI